MGTSTMTNEKRNLIVSVAMFVLAVAYLGWAMSYPSGVRAVPVLVGWITVGLCLLDVVAHSGTGFGNTVAGVLSGRAHLAAVEDLRITRDEYLAAIWMVICLVAVLLLGFEIAILVYVFAYMMIQGRLGIRLSIIVAVATTFVVWLVFEYLLNFELYQGMLLGG
jgi:hypothetical protein